MTKDTMDLTLSEKQVEKLKEKIPLEALRNLIDNIANINHLSNSTFNKKKFDGNIALLESYNPQNALEATLAHQMIMTSEMIAHCYSIVRAETNVKIKKDMGDLAMKFSNTFMKQTETFRKLQTGASQRIQVEHVNVMPGGQAIVGNVSNTIQKPINEE